MIATENSNPTGRAQPDVQTVRLARIRDALGGAPANLLDYGCGEGAFVAFARARGVRATGIDQGPGLQLADVASQRFQAICMIEVIEHLRDPVAVFGQLIALMARRSVIYCESSFVDDFPDLRDAPYINPEIGHRCVFSRAGVASIANRFALECTWINNNVFMLTRPATRLSRTTRAVRLGALCLRRRMGLAEAREGKGANCQLGERRRRLLRSFAMRWVFRHSGPRKPCAE